jgi:hypothetical protein
MGGHLARTESITDDPKTNCRTGVETMNLIQEDVARAHMRARLDEARRNRRGNQLARAQRLSRRAQRNAMQARLARERAL